jgi:hypothetical protein
LVCQSEGFRRPARCCSNLTHTTLHSIKIYRYGMLLELTPKSTT